MAIAILYRFQFDYSVLRALALALALVCALAVAMAVTVAAVTALTPVIVGCCLAAAPVVGKLAVGAVLIAAYAWLTYPKGK